MENKILVTAFYKFQSFADEQLKVIKKSLEELGSKLELKGLILIGPEGINSTVSGKKESIEQLKKFVVSLTDDHSIWFKDSWCDWKPFSRFKVKIKEEIVTIGRPGLVPPSEQNFHLNPDEWHKAMDDENVIVVDTRNTYETDIGKFKNALDLRIDDFQEFTQKFLEQDIDKNKKVLIYCTGGIRCEKAILELHEKGYKNVFQLNGGIINYIKEKPEGYWDGECFVFDHRVALDKNLKASKQYSLCPHCGNPGMEVIECAQCGTEQIVCEKCLKQGPDKKTCTKNCAYHFRMGHKTKRIHRDGFKIKKE